MGFGLSLSIVSPPLDRDALVAFIEQLPGLTRRADGALMLGDPVLVRIQADSVLIAFQWQDNRFGHGAAIGDWILSRHRCTGQCIDYGTLLPDNDACRAHLAATSLVTPSSPARVHAALSGVLVGAEVARLEVSRSELIAHLQRGAGPVGALRLARQDVQVTPSPQTAVGLEEDEALLLTLHDALEGYGPVVSVEVGWSEALTIRWSGEELTLQALSDAHPGEIIWTVEGLQGAVAVGIAGGGSVAL